MLTLLPLERLLEPPSLSKPTLMMAHSYDETLHIDDFLLFSLATRPDSHQVTIREVQENLEKIIKPYIPYKFKNSSESPKVLFFSEQTGPLDETRDDHSGKAYRIMIDYAWNLDFSKGKIWASIEHNSGESDYEPLLKAIARLRDPVCLSDLTYFDILQNCLVPWRIRRRVARDIKQIPSLGYVGDIFFETDGKQFTLLLRNELTSENFKTKQSHYFPPITYELDLPLDWSRLSITNSTHLQLNNGMTSSSVTGGLVSRRFVLKEGNDPMDFFEQLRRLLKWNTVNSKVSGHAYLPYESNASNEGFLLRDERQPSRKTKRVVYNQSGREVDDTTSTQILKKLPFKLVEPSILAYSVGKGREVHLYSWPVPDRVYALVHEKVRYFVATRTLEHVFNLSALDDTISKYNSSHKSNHFSKLQDHLLSLGAREEALASLLAAAESLPEGKIDQLITNTSSTVVAPLELLTQKEVERVFCKIGPTARLAKELAYLQAAAAHRVLSPIIPRVYTISLENSPLIACGDNLSALITYDVRCDQNIAPEAITEYLTLRRGVLNDAVQKLNLDTRTVKSNQLIDLFNTALLDVYLAPESTNTIFSTDKVDLFPLVEKFEQMLAQVPYQVRDEFNSILKTYRTIQNTHLDNSNRGVMNLDLQIRNRIHRGKSHGEPLRALVDFGLVQVAPLAAIGSFGSSTALPTSRLASTYLTLLTLIQKKTQREPFRDLDYASTQFSRDVCAVGTRIYLARAVHAATNGYSYNRFLSQARELGRPIAK